MNQAPLTKEMLSCDPAPHSMLLLRAGTACIDAAVYTPGSLPGGDGLLLRSWPVAPPQGPLRALEEVVYGNPLLLCDFKRTTVLIEDTSYAVMPSQLDAAVATEAYCALNPGTHPASVALTGLGTRNAVALHSTAGDVWGFVRRTFPTARALPHIVPLVRYFAARAARGNKRCMTVSLRRNSMDLIVLEGNTLLQANTFSFSTPADAVYLMLASHQALGMDPRTDELQLAGSPQVRDQVMPMLRRWVARVMPVIFPPAMFDAGSEALNAPFDLIVTPLEGTI